MCQWVFWQASSQEEALLMLSLKKFGFLHNITITWMSVCELLLSIRKLRHVCSLFLGCLYFSFFGKWMRFWHFVTCWNWTELNNQDSFYFFILFFFSFFFCMTLLMSIALDNYSGRKKRKKNNSRSPPNSLVSSQSIYRVGSFFHGF